MELPIFVTPSMIKNCIPSVNFFMKASVDILLATYQGERYLEAQIASLLAQTHRQFRLFVRDDGSTDRTLSLLEHFARAHPTRIYLIPSHGKRLGIIGNFNALLEQAEAPYVMCCDQDDVWKEDKIARSLAVMQRLEAIHGTHSPLLVHTDVTVVTCDLTVIDPSLWHYSRLNPQATHLNRLMSQNCITGCTLIMNQPLRQLALPIPHEAMMHDWWLGLVASAFGTIAPCFESTLFYRQHAHNDTGAQPCRNGRGLWRLLQGLWNRQKRRAAHHRFVATTVQAALFLERYATHLTPQQHAIVSDYATLPLRHPLIKRLIVLKGRYVKHTVLKTCGLLWVI